MPWLAQAQDTRLETAGVRLGLGANQSSSDFREVEAFAEWALPWKLELGRQWRFESAAQITAGWIGDGKDAVIASVGPAAALVKTGLPFGLEGGVSPTVITRSSFETKDIGTPFQFTSHIGVFWDAPFHVRVAYYYEHISNAGLSRPNPGLNMHTISLSYRF